MSENSKIEWTEATFNPLRARNLETGKVGWFCEHASRECDNCYAEKMNVNTYFGNGLPYKASALPQLELFLDEKMLTKPLRWRKPRKVFVCSMTDLFGRFVKDEWIDRIFAVMALAPQHTFQVLTKRPERMRDYLSVGIEQGRKVAIGNAAVWTHSASWPLPNVWLGVSAGDQKTADERIPLLLQTPAAVRFISAEPLLGPVSLTDINPARDETPDRLDALTGFTWCSHGGTKTDSKLDWVIVGGESGSNARPIHPDWARSLRDQCVSAGVSFFFKQWGAHLPMPMRTSGTCDHPSSDGAQGPVRLLKPQRVDIWRCNLCGVLHDQDIDFIRTGKKEAGRVLDGRTWDEMPIVSQ